MKMVAAVDVPAICWRSAVEAEQVGGEINAG
jgi:hypothetical protein